MAGNSIEMSGKRFPEEFDRIDKVKSSDKFLVNDSEDGINKYCTPSQINKGLLELELHYEDAVKAKNDAEAAATAAAESATEAGNSAEAAAGSATEAKSSETNAKSSENAAETSETNAKSSETKASGYADNASASATAAKSSETAAKSSADNAKTSEDNAKTSETNAKSSESAAKTSETKALASETNAKKSETAAKASEVAAKESETKAEEVVATVAAGIVLLNRDLGKYDTSISLPMSVEKSGKYVDPDGQEKSSASMGISAPLEVKSGNIYLLQCAAAVGTGVALFARKVTNTYDKVIAYSYTYNGDGTIATATADYDPELVYSYSYNEEGVATITDKDGETVPELPATHQVTESFYEPLFRTNDATMPKSGYYLLLCTQDMEIVVSAASSDITGKNLLGVRYGVFASVATNFVGSPGQKVIAQAFAELYAAVQALSSVVDNAGHLKADILDIANLPKVCGEDMYLTGEGAPAAPPTVPFQEYYDSSNNKFYRAKGVLPDTPSIGDWVALN